ncbi:methyltransferase [Streptomyces sp. NPDC005500]|uniref:methyltransferase n=1 Tax=Streptomyces sp. NPDC005500 TaxID=3155007 RepID=UPI0033BE08E0
MPVKRPDNHNSGHQIDDKKLWDVVFGAFGYPAILIAHKIRIFDLLAQGPRALEEICNEKNIARRPAQAMLSAAASQGFIEVRDGRYQLTSLAQEYLTPGSPRYFGHYWDFIIENHQVFSFEVLEQAVLEDAPQGHKLKERNTQGFADAMRSIGASASIWPRLVDLSTHRMLLDIGGGAGGHALGAVRQWPHLRATVFDLEAVSEIARREVGIDKLGDRIEVQTGDMWTSPFPAADVHFYSYIFHTCSIEQCALLVRKSFSSLPVGGRIIIHQVFYNSDKSGPFAAAAFSMEMLAWTSGEQYSTPEIGKLLQDAGFRDVETRPTFGYCSMVTGVKR